jgi:hypothetical protein
MRRTDSEMQEKIESLLKEAADPRDRALLMILYHISTVLIDNVSAVRESTDEFKLHREEYDAHVKREEAYINQGRGMWRIVGLLMFVVQSTLGYLYYQNVDAMRELQTAVVLINRDMAVIKERHRIEDKTGQQP